MSTKVSGKIRSINAVRSVTYIQLDNDPNTGPKDNLWGLKLDHTNYNAIFSLILAAAANRWTLSIRIEGDAEINSEVEAYIKAAIVVFE